LLARPHPRRDRQSANVEYAAPDHPAGVLMPHERRGRSGFADARVLRT
jgi:hypothetical protein